MPLVIQAGLWGLLSGSALVLGAAIGAFVKLPQRVIAAVMAFGAGVLISALSFDLMDEANCGGGVLFTTVGFLGSRPTCSHFVLDSSSKLGYIVCQFFSPRGALARRRRKREQNTVSCRGSHPLPREARAARRACPQPQAGLTAVRPA